MGYWNDDDEFWASEKWEEGNRFKMVVQIVLGTLALGAAIVLLWLGGAL